MFSRGAQRLTFYFWVPWASEFSGTCAPGSFVEDAEGRHLDQHRSGGGGARAGHARHFEDQATVVHILRGPSS